MFRHCEPKMLLIIVPWLSVGGLSNQIQSSNCKSIAYVLSICLHSIVQQEIRKVYMMGSVWNYVSTKISLFTSHSFVIHLDFLKSFSWIQAFYKFILLLYLPKLPISRLLWSPYNRVKSIAITFPITQIHKNSHPTLWLGILNGICK